MTLTTSAARYNAGGTWTSKHDDLQSMNKMATTPPKQYTLLVSLSTSAGNVQHVPNSKQRGIVTFMVVQCLPDAVCHLCRNPCLWSSGPRPKGPKVHHPGEKATAKPNLSHHPPEAHVQI